MSVIASFDSPAAYAAGLAEALRTDARFAPFIGYRPPNLEHSAAHLAGLQALLFDTGWSRLGWPQSAGLSAEISRNWPLPSFTKT